MNTINGYIQRKTAGGRIKMLLAAQEGKSGMYLKPRKAGDAGVHFAAAEAFLTCGDGRDVLTRLDRGQTVIWTATVIETAS